MPVTLTVNGRTTAAAAGAIALRLRRRRSASACRRRASRNGKCKECVVEIARRHGDCCRRPPQRSRTSRAPFRLSCQARARVGERRRSAATRCAAGRCASSGTRCTSCRAHARLTLDPAVTRDGDRILIDGDEIARSSRPDPRPRDGSGHHDDRPPSVQSRNRRADRRHVVREPAALRRLRRHVAHPLRHRASGQAADADARRLPDARDRRVPGRSGDASTRWSSSATRRCAICSSGRTCTRSARTRTARSPRSKWPRASAPRPASTTTGRRCLLPIHPKARVYGLPIISGHVGADAAACMLAVDLAHEDRLVAVMDIGTNTELIVGNRHRILAASCPAGPAFEGGAIACGMPALDGAIEDVSVGRRRDVHARRDRRRDAARASAAPAWSTC